MKKVLIFSLGLLLMMSSCGTYEATGAYTGAQFGSIIGSAGNNTHCCTIRCGGDISSYAE